MKRGDENVGYTKEIRSKLEESNEVGFLINNRIQN